MPGVSTYLANVYLNYLRGQSPPTPPSTVYVALFNGDPETTGTEVTTQIITTGRVAANFGAPSNKAITNTAVIDFGASAGNATITHMALMDSKTGGNILVPKQLTAQRQIAQGDPVKYATGNLTFQF